MSIVTPPGRLAKKNSGFTLTELAIVLVIVSLLIGGMLMPLSAQQDYRDIAETEKSLSEAREALIGFAVVNRRFPRPAISAVNGAEKSQCAGASVAIREAACTGFIPWETLGVKKLDAWNKIIRYSVTPGFAGGIVIGTDIPIALTTVATKNIRTRDASISADAPLATSVPAVVFSQGKHNWGTDNAGNTFPDSSSNNGDEDANNAGPTTFYSRLIAADTALPGGEFDDIVAWIPATLLFNRMISAGQLP